MRDSRRTAGWTAGLAASALILTGCGGDSADAGDSEGQSENQSVTIGYVPWDEVMAATYLWEHILEEQDFDVELVQLEVSPVYLGVADNDLDLYMGGLQSTHPDQWEEYGDQFDSVAQWYEPLRHGLVVPEYVEGIDSVDDLAGQAEMFDERIVGIEAGSGLMQELDAAANVYDLSEYEMIGSSTASMLTEFEQAINNNEPVLATAWNPHWAVGEYNMQFLDDPEGVFTDGDQYHVIAGEEAQQKDELMELLAGFELNDDQFYSLLNAIREAGDDNEGAGVEAWLEVDEHAELVDSWVDGS